MVELLLLTINYIIMNSKQIADEAISILNKKITNEVFLIIQNNRVLMHEYLRAVESDGLDTVNKTIGKVVKRLL